MSEFSQAFPPECTGWELTPGLVREEEEGGDRPLVPGTLHLPTSWQPALGPPASPMGLAPVGPDADVSLLEIPLPSDQDVQNKSSHRRRKLPAWLEL